MRGTVSLLSKTPYPQPESRQAAEDLWNPSCKKALKQRTMPDGEGKIPMLPE